MIVDYPKRNGVMEPKPLYESAFTDVSSRGPKDLFPCEQADQLVAIRGEIRSTGAANYQHRQTLSTKDHATHARCRREPKDVT
jgi:hypothetical protein